MNHKVVLAAVICLALGLAAGAAGMRYLQSDGASPAANKPGTIDATGRAGPDEDAGDHDHGAHAGDDEDAGHDDHAGHDEDTGHDDHSGDDEDAGHGEHGEHDGGDEDAGHDDHAGHEDHDEHAGGGEDAGHEDHAAHAGASGQGDEHGGHEDHEEGVVHLNAAKLSGLNLAHVEVKRGSVSTIVELPAEVMWNADGVAHVVPRVSGQAREVHGRLGDQVHAGDVLAVIDSRELAEARAGDLAAEARLSLMRVSLERVEKLFEKQIAPEEELLKAKLELAEAGIDHRNTEAKLRALGLTAAQIQELHGEEAVDYSRYEIKAPFDGVVIEKHMTLGEVVSPGSAVFMLADLSDVWVLGRAYERDIRFLKPGQATTVRLDALPGELFEGVVDYIGSQLDPDTRTVQVRVVLSNHERRFRRGMFGVVTVVTSREGEPATSAPSSLLVPLSALQRTNDGHVVYRVVEEGVFEAVQVQVMAKSQEFAEIKAELQPGDTVVMGETFVLKSEMGLKDMSGGHAGHGH